MRRRVLPIQLYHVNKTKKIETDNINMGCDIPHFCQLGPIFARPVSESDSHFRFLYTNVT